MEIIEVEKGIRYPCGLPNAFFYLNNFHTLSPPFMLYDTLFLCIYRA